MSDCKHDWIGDTCVRCGVAWGVYARKCIRERDELKARLDSLATQTGSLSPITEDGMTRLRQENARLKALVVELERDKERLDWLESQSDGSPWLARHSSTKRGFRLHNTGLHLFTKKSNTTARQAIDAAMKEGK